MCASVDEAVAAIGVLRARTSEGLGDLGLVMAAAGSHPFAEPEELPITDEKRYEEMVGYAGVTARRQGVNGLHVHVGMPSADECMTTLEMLLPWMPFVLAASANSPFMSGRATGLASNRARSWRSCRGAARLPSSTDTAAGRPGSKGSSRPDC